MAFAYNWLSSKEKTHLSELHISYREDEIIVNIKCSDYVRPPAISYKRNGSSTLIESGKKDMLVEDDFVNVFGEDMMQFFLHQESIWKKFSIIRHVEDEEKVEEKGVSDEKRDFSNLDPIRNRILKCLSASLICLESPLLVKCVVLELSILAQAIFLVKLMNPFTLKTIQFNYDQSIDIDEVLALVDWNEGNRLKVIFKIQIFSLDNVKSINKKTFSSVFWIQINNRIK